MHPLVQVERVPVLPLGAIRSNSLESALFAASAARWVLGQAAGPVDVLHAHGDMAEALIGGFLARRLGASFALTIHAGLTRSRMAGLFQAIAFRLPHLVIAVSEPIRREVVDLGIPSARVVVCPSGVECARFGEADAAVVTSMRSLVEAEDGTLTVVAVGRLHPMKGHRHLIRAAESLAARGVHARVLIAGGGPLESEIRRQSEGIPGILVLGERSREEVAALLQLADVFVHPSLDLHGQREGTPTAVLEAMAAGLPVVGTALGGIPALLGRDEGGRIVPPADSGALVAAIAELAADPALRRVLGERNRRVAQSFDWGIVAGEVLTHYARLCEARGHRHRPAVR